METYRRIWGLECTSLLVLLVFFVLSFWSENALKVLKSRIFGDFEQFSAPVNHTKDPNTSKEVHPRPHILQSVSKNLYCQKMYSKLSFLKWKCPPYSVQMSYIWYFWSFSGPLTHSKAPYTSIEVHPEAHILPKVSINLYYQKMHSILRF